MMSSYPPISPWGVSKTLELVDGFRALCNINIISSFVCNPFGKYHNPLWKPPWTNVCVASACLAATRLNQIRGEDEPADGQFVSRSEQLDNLFLEASNPTELLAKRWQVLKTQVPWIDSIDVMAEQVTDSSQIQAECATHTYTWMGCCTPFCGSCDTMLTWRLSQMIGWLVVRMLVVCTCFAFDIPPCHFSDVKNYGRCKYWKKFQFVWVIFFQLWSLTEKYEIWTVSKHIYGKSPPIKCFVGRVVNQKPWRPRKKAIAR